MVCRILHFKRFICFFPLVDMNACISVRPNSCLLKGRIAFVVRGSHGIVWASVNAFLGPKVIFWHYNDRIVRVKWRLSDYGVEIDNVFCSFFDMHGYICFVNVIDVIVDKFCTRWIYVHVDNFGVFDKSISSATIDKYDNIMNTNQRSAFILLRIVTKCKRSMRRSGNILKIVSFSPIRLADSVYMLSRWVRVMTHELAKCFIRYGIVVNGIASVSIMGVDNSWNM